MRRKFLPPITAVIARLGGDNVASAIVNKVVREEFAAAEAERHHLISQEPAENISLLLPKKTRYDR